MKVIITALILLFSISAHAVSVRVDVDAELNQKKFNNNAQAATVWAQQVTQNSLDIIRAQSGLDAGIAEIRVWTNVDPFGTSVSVADQLQAYSDFIDVQELNYDIYVMLSGTWPDGADTRGAAYLDSICPNRSKSGTLMVCTLTTSKVYPKGFTLSNPVSIVQAPWALDNATSIYKATQIINHELGHMFGLEHTNCQNPPIDACNNFESGCYSGPLQCPAAGRGTVMSLCDREACAPVANFQTFHPLMETQLRSLVSNASCIADSNSIFSSSFE